MNRFSRRAVFARAVRLTTLLLGASFATAASASGWDQALSSGEAASAQIVDVAAVAGARWLLVQSSDGIVLQREAAGQTTVAATTAPGARLLALADGGVLLIESAPNRLRRYDTQGQLVWQRNVTPKLVLTDNAGGFWIETADDLQRIAADGSLRATLTPNAFPVIVRTVVDEPLPLVYQRPQRAIDPSNGDLLIAGRDHVIAAAGRAQLARFDRQGRQRWSWTDTGAEPGFEFSAVATGANISCAAARLPGGNSVQRLCFDANGQLRWQATQQLGANSASSVIAVGNDGSLYSLDTINRTGAQLTRISPSGAALWTQALPAAIGDACAAPGPGCSLHVAANGDATVLTAAVGGVARTRLVGFAAGGALRFDRELPVSAIVTLSRDAAGHVLLVGTREAGIRRLVELDAQGTIVVENTELTSPLRARARAVATNAQGMTFIVSAADRATQYRLRRVDADGSTAWDIELAGALDQAQALANDDRVCVSEVRVVNGQPDNRVRCIAVADGRVLWSRTIEAPLNFRSRVPLPPSTFRLRDDDRVVVSYLYNGVQLHDPAGAVQLQAGTTERTPFGDLNAGGDSVVVERLATTPSTSDEGKLIYRNRNGREIYSLDLQAIGIQPQQLRLGDDDAVYIVGKASQSLPETYVWRVDLDGTVGWRRPIDSIANTTVRLHLTDDSLVVERRYGTPLDDARIALDVQQRSTGNRRWRKTFEADAFDIDTTSGDFVVFRSGVGRWQLTGVSSENGVVLSSSTIACNAEDCTLGGAAAEAGLASVAGSDRAAARTYRYDDTVRVDQIGIAGAWGSYYGEGEGLVVDWLPQARLLFMPWFTYSVNGGNETAQQRWYVVQAANVNADARSADVEIYAVTGGAFDSAEPRVTTRVGNGVLRFFDCANGALSYTFDPRYNSGASGSISLSRLSPATQPCILADGRVQPAPEARPPSKGFDARQSGSWYEPATGGQGMQLTVQPDGVFFAAWFAYDVAGAADDSGKQHWFTLQGNLAQATNGRVELVIVQTVGGAFDRSATRNRYVVGQATLQMNGCDRATLSYRFGDDERAGAFAGRSGELEMIKEGGCGP